MRRNTVHRQVYASPRKRARTHTREAATVAENDSERRAECCSSPIGTDMKALVPAAPIAQQQIAAASADRSRCAHRQIGAETERLTKEARAERAADRSAQLCGGRPGGSGRG